MPYYRTYNRRRPAYRRRRIMRKKPVQQGGYLNTAAKALAIAYGVKKLVNAEKFHFDYSSGAITPNTTAAIAPIQLIPEGDDTQTRTGRSIKLDGVYLKLFMNSASAATTSVTVRFIVFIDWWSDGVVPSATDLLVTGDYLSFRQVDSVSAKRFKVLMDQNFDMTVQSGDEAQKTIKRYFPVKHHLKFINTTGVQAATGSGQMYYLIVTGGTVGTNAVSALIQTRSHYYDN